MYNNGITSLLQVSKTAKSRLKTLLMNEFQFINDVEYSFVNLRPGVNYCTTDGNLKD